MAPMQLIIFSAAVPALPGPATERAQQESPKLAASSRRKHLLSAGLAGLALLPGRRAGAMGIERESVDLPAFQAFQLPEAVQELQVPH